MSFCYFHSDLYITRKADRKAVESDVKVTLFQKDLLKHPYNKV